MTNYSYVETVVKRKDKTTLYLMRILMVLAVLFAIYFSRFNAVTLVISILLIMAVIYFFPLLDMEYEYIFVDGQLDFDKIMGGSKRKSDLRIDFENVEIMAPIGSHTLDSYKQTNIKNKDYTSRDKDIKPYVIIFRKEDTAYRILFEPSKEMIEAIKRKAPRKLSQY